MSSRYCSVCGKDISHRHHNAIYCEDCAKIQEIIIKKNFANQITDGYYGSFCTACGEVLTLENTTTSLAKRSDRRCRYCHNLYRRKWKREKRLELIEVFGGKCKCGFSDWRALQIDHINGDGVKDLERFGGNRDVFYNYLLKMDPDERSNSYQLLCANCNWIKRYENEEHGGYKKEYFQELAERYD